MEDFFELIKREICLYRDLLDAYEQDIMRYKKIYLLGAGKGGVMVAHSFDRLIDKAVFVDSNHHKIGKIICEGITCIGWDQISDDGNTIAVLTSIKNTGDMVKRILEKYPNMRVDVDYIRLLTRFLYSKETLEHRREIIEAYGLLKDDESKRIYLRVLQNRVSALEDITCDIYSEHQYFREEFRKYIGKNEILLDGGAYTGDTSVEFIEYMNGKDFKYIYAFELDKENYKVMLDNPELHDKRVRKINLGLSNTNEAIRYSCSQSCSSYVRDVIPEESVEGWVVAFDDFANTDSLIDDMPTIIKMDIEGAEMDALRGMEKTIKQNRPKLCICIYHLHEDLWGIPLYLSGLLKDYDFYIRHHSLFHAETVLYGFDRMMANCYEVTFVKRKSQINQSFSS